MDNKRKDNAFYQAKYDYYKVYIKWVTIAACLASVTYFISDCQLFGRFARETLLPRFIILIPMCIFYFVFGKISDYRIMLTFSYVIIHGIMWCTIWAIYYLPVKQHANEGFIIMQFMFLALGLAAPFKMSTVANILLIVDIILSYPINYYENMDLMLSLGIPLTVGICVVGYVMEKVYGDQYQVSQTLELAYSHDQLTKVFNRNVLKEITDADAVSLSIPGADNAYFMLLDIDFFKKVNDTYGHDKGDIVLQYVAETIKQNVRYEDLIIRWGGEEFVIILPDCTKEKAREIAETVRKGIKLGNSHVCSITASIGVAKYNGGNYQNAITNSDTALYYAKAHGRNQVVVFEDMKTEDAQ